MAFRSFTNGANVDCPNRGSFASAIDPLPLFGAQGFYGLGEEMLFFFGDVASFKRNEFLSRSQEFRMVAARISIGLTGRSAGAGAPADLPSVGRPLTSSVSVSVSGTRAWPPAWYGASGKVSLAAYFFCNCTNLMRIMCV
jgi:hypothetical protein